VLLSWAGTMFEYLMPTLFLRTPQETLLHDALRRAVQVQRRFGEERKVPWGISESAYHVLDHQGHYQYRAFGVPRLGLRRDGGDRLVVAPYASLMAVAWAPGPVRSNLHELTELGGMGPWGPYEAVDFGEGAGGGAPGGALLHEPPPRDDHGGARELPHRGCPGGPASPGSPGGHHRALPPRADSLASARGTALGGTRPLHSRRSGRGRVRALAALSRPEAPAHPHPLQRDVFGLSRSSGGGGEPLEGLERDPGRARDGLSRRRPSLGAHGPGHRGKLDPPSSSRRPRGREPGHHLPSPSGGVRSAGPGDPYPGGGDGGPSGRCGDAGDPTGERGGSAPATAPRSHAGGGFGAAGG
jgi:hypothetical protein